MTFNHGNNQGCCGRQAAGNASVNCTALGPFRAIDAACIVPPPNTGSIIPFSSGSTAASMATAATGLVSTASAIGFGSSVPGITITGTTITLGGATPLDESFSVPRVGSITALSATFVSTAAVPTLTGTTTITAQIYRAPQGSNVYTATGALVVLAPPLPAGLAIGSTTFGNGSFAPVPVALGDRLLMVFSATTSTAVAATIVGNASAGITIQ